MADIIGTSDVDNLTSMDEVNTIIGGTGDDNIDATSGVNTIEYNSGDGVDAVKVALPRTFQFADFLSQAQSALAQLENFSGSAYSNSYFATADSSLMAMLPADLQASIGALQETYVPDQGFVAGSLDPAAATAAFNSLIGWINTSTSNVIKFGPGITLANVSLQVGSTTDYGSQTIPTEFSVSVGNSDQGMIFDVGSPGSVAGDASAPTQLDLTFQFADGTTATLADLMARGNQGAMGMQNGTDDSDLLRGSLAGDMLFGNGGNDQLDGGAGDDFLFGGTGDDVIGGGTGNDTIYGEDGNDVMASGKNGSFMSGGQGNDVYAFNRGDGNVFIDNGDTDGSGVDTISFGGGVAPSDLVASVDPQTGNLTLGIAGSSDQITITWFDNTNGMAARVDQVIDRVQFIDADGTAHVYDLASLVQAAFPNPGAADPSASVALVGPDATELAVDAAGGEDAAYYAEYGTLFGTAESPNQAPTAAHIDDVTVKQGATDFSFALPAGTFTDPEGATLQLSATTSNGDPLPSWLQFDAAHGTFSGTPTNGDVGAFDVKVLATDPGGLSASQTFHLTVENVNDAPTATDGALHFDFDQDQAVGYRVAPDNFNDIDAGDSLTYSATLADGSPLPSWLQFDATNLILAGKPANGDVGDLSVIVTATDQGGLSASKAIDITVHNVNDAPVATDGAAEATATEDAAFAYTLPDGTFTDMDLGDKLTYSARMADGTDLPSWLQFDAATGAFAGTPTNGDVGSLSVVVTATDLAGASATKALDLTVANTNDAPTANDGVASANATQDASFSYTLPADTFNDVDAGDKLTYSATMSDGTALPTWLHIDGTSGMLSGTPANGDVGNLSLIVTATDLAGASATKALDLNVANIDDAPTVAHAIADQTATALSPYSMTVPANTFSDVDLGDSLTLSARLANGSPLPSWLSFDPSTGTLSGTAGSSGTWSIEVVATDLSGASVGDTFALTVGAGSVGSPPPVGDPSPVGATINGTSGNDRLNGTAGNDKINGGKGKDVLSGGAGDDQLFVTADATWGSGSTRTNVVTGEKVSISGKNRIYDVFDGGAGSDILLGTSGNDAILLDDSKSSALQNGARIIGVEKIDAGGGNDLVDLTSKRYSYGDVEIDGGSGNDVLWSSKGNDVLRGGSGDDSMDGGAGNDYLDGGSGNDKLNGGAGVDMLQGGSGDDKLTDTSGNGVMDGGSGKDTLVEGSGNSLMIGGKGNDKLTLGGGYDVIAFNRGDGKDVVSNGGKSGNATLSLGGGISYQDISLSRSGADLILNVGNGDQITFSKWYDGKKYQAVSKLQVVAEAMPGFDAGGSNPLLDNNVETFDFKGLVKAFDAAQHHGRGVSKWAVTNALAQFHLGGSDTAAVGGDLAYQYGVNGTLAGIAVNAVQGQVGSSQFGQQAQTLHNEAALKDGLVKLV
jgi:Ca2+-binding RTX toxin-like protein